LRSIVTGGAGFIGSHVVDRLVAAGHHVTVLDDLSTGRRENLPPGVELIEADISTPAVPGLIAELRPDLVVHAAAQASVTASMEDPVRDAQVNVLGTLRVLEGLARASCPRLVYVTTGGALYGDPVRLPCREDDPIRPLSPYGLSKWTAERYANLLAGQATLVSLRLANVYGPRQLGGGEAGVVSVFIDRMLAGGPIEIHGDGEQTRDFVFVGDVVDAVDAAVTTRRSGSYNVGTGVATSINELYERLASIAGYRGAVRHAEPRPGDVRHSRLDPGAAGRELGWTAATTLEAGLAATYRSWLAARQTPSDRSHPGS
jgi:UDP-glucose 4-epimerase